MWEIDDIKLEEKKIEKGILMVTYPYKKYPMEDLYDIFTTIKQYFVDRDVIMIPEEINMQSSTKELVDIKNRIEKELQRRKVRNVKKVL